MPSQHYKIIITFFVFLGVFSPHLCFAQRASTPVGSTAVEQALTAQDELIKKDRIIEDLRLEKAALEDMAEELQLEKERLEKEIYDMLFGDFEASARKSVNYRLQQIRAPYEEEIAIMKKVIASYKEDLQEREKEIGQLVEINRELNEKWEDAETKKAEYEISFEEMKIEMRNLEDLAKEKDSAINREVAKRLQEERAPLEAKISLLKEQIAEIEEKHAVEKINFEEENAQLNEKILAYKDQIQDESRKIVAKESELEKLWERISVYKSEAEQARAELHEKDARITEQKDQLDVLNKLKAKLSRYEDEIEEDKADLEERDAHIVSLKGKLDKRFKLKDKTEKYEREIKKQKEELDKQSTMIEELKDELALANKKIKETDRAHNKLHGEKQYIEKKYEDLLKKHDETRQEFTKKIKKQEKRVMTAEQRSSDKGAYMRLLKEEIQNALDLLSVY